MDLPVNHEITFKGKRFVYPSEECKKCEVVLDLQKAFEKARNPDGTFQFPVFELAHCSCCALKPKGHTQLQIIPDSKNSC